jgi:RNA polymerase sigma factor (sigma-70 family)
MAETNHRPETPEQQAIRALLAEYGDQIWIAFRYGLGDEDAAADLYGDFCLKIVEKYRRILAVDRSKIRGYLHQMARNMINEHLRRKYREQAAMQAYGEQLEKDNDPTVNPLIRIEEAKQLDRFWRAVKKNVPAKFREAAEACTGRNLPYARVSREIGVHPDTVKGWNLAGLHRMRQEAEVHLKDFMTA